MRRRRSNGIAKFLKMADAILGKLLFLVKAGLGVEGDPASGKLTRIDQCWANDGI